MRRAKIVATMGPATASVDSIEKLIDAGMNVARLNMSHGNRADQIKMLADIRSAAKNRNVDIGIFADLQGPKIRLGLFENGPVELISGDDFTITTSEFLGTKEKASTTYKGLPGDVNPGDVILIDDGLVVLKVKSKTNTDVLCAVVEGGNVSNNKGINLPGVAVSVPALSDKDEEDLRWALGAGIDMVALSFVRSAQDYADVKRIMDEMNIHVPVIAKIEKPQAVNALVEIIEAFDAIMVARGDLGVELPLEQVPIVQKRAITLSRQFAKPVIVATQMLDSMINSHRPTRAETSDVANAVFDGADALMLSAETSVGVDPAHVVSVMSSIIETVEQDGGTKLPDLGTESIRSTAYAVTRGAVQIAQSVSASYLCAFTETGRSARLVSRLRPVVPLLAFTPMEQVRRQLSLVWGVQSFEVAPASSTDEMV
ncbi:MAG: pyruvate kinase, partial [Actinobacteria bacterium]|nr:pyruvate kinase [Actinomycetota bacterium]